MARLTWALSFAVLLTGQRLLTLAWRSDFLCRPYAAGVLLAGFGELAVGIALSLLLVPGRNEEDSAGRAALGWIAAVAWLGISAIAFFYEAVFGRLPSVASLYYVDELDAIGSSLVAHAPVVALAASVVVGVAGIAAARTWVRRRVGDRPTGALGGALMVAAIVVPCATHFAPSVVPDAVYWGSRHLLFHALAETALTLGETAGEGAIDRKRVREVQGLLGVVPADASGDSAAPLCSDRPSPPRKPAEQPRSLIILVLESLSTVQLEARVGDEPLMPALQRIARSTLHFRNIFAAGTKSAQALPALFSGLPAQTHKNLLWQQPVPRLNGFAGALRRHGYHSAYLHGSDLSFEHQRTYLKAAGFDELIEFDADDPGSWSFGWGYDDRTMFDKLKGWVEARRTTGGPFLATLFTIGTHDPYLLPPDRPARFGGQMEDLHGTDIWGRTRAYADERTAMLEAFRFLDEQVGEFYDWYVANERPKGTILAIVGDHVPHLETRGTGRAGQRFRVPLLIDGEGIEVPSGATDRLGGLHDLPATMAGLLGTEPPACDLGVDLLAPAESFSARRVVYSVEGDSLAGIYLWTGGRQYFVDRVSGDLRNIDNEPVLGGTPETPEPAGRVRALLERLLPLNAYLLEHNAYVRKPAHGPRAAISTLEGAPLRVSHRGNLEGPGRPAPENSLAALEAVSASAVQWVEVDVQLTGDGLVVLLHDPVVPVRGQPVYVASRTLAQLRSDPALADLATLDEAFAAYGDKLRWIVELKQQPFPTQDLKLTQEVARVIRKHGLEERVIADSVSADLATSLATLCPKCGAGWDTPQGSPVTDAHLDYVVQLDLGWVFVHHTSYDADLLRRAHARGVRVMVYTVNDPTWMGKLRVPPDALMSDLLSVLVVP